MIVSRPWGKQRGGMIEASLIEIEQFRHLISNERVSAEGDA